MLNAGVTLRAVDGGVPLRAFDDGMMLLCCIACPIACIGCGVLLRAFDQMSHCARLMVCTIARL